MRSRLLISVVLAGCGVLLAGCGGSSSSSTTTAAAGATTTPTSTAGSTTMAMSGEHPCDGYGSKTVGAYQVLVAIEEHAPLLTADEAAASTDPEAHIIVAGTGANNDESADKHVEVHICDAATGAPAQHLTPTVTIQDLTGGGAAQALAVAEVYGKGEDPADVHYGNNVAFPSGHQAEVTVTVDGASESFKIAVE